MQEGAHALRRGRVCVPELCRVPQDGYTPLHVAAANSHNAVVEMLLAARAATDSTDRVRGVWNGGCG